MAGPTHAPRAADERDAPAPAVDAFGVDLRRALLPQVAALGDRYDAWVHDAVPPNTATKLRGDSRERWAGSLRIFESDWLESMSHIPWWLVLVVWVPVAGALLLAPVLAFDRGWLPTLLQALGGFAFWTLFEYTLHRFVFHYRPRSAFGRQAHFLAHGIHHLDPWDGTRLVFPPLAGFGIAFLLWLAFEIVLPTPAALAAMGGLLAGYIAYDMTHYYTHHAKPRSRWGRFLKRYHLAHHHQQWERMFGVSQPLWDLVFGTTPEDRDARATRKSGPRSA